MTSLYEHEVLLDALRSAVCDIGLDEEDMDVVLKTLSSAAMEDTSFREKFLYTMRADSYQTSADYTDAVEVGTVNTDLIPKLKMPVYSFKRKSKPIIQIRSYVDSAAKKFFEENYGEEFDLRYLQLNTHDHAVAAMSRKIEYDVLLKHAWENYANPLLLPTNYDFSVIDVGGDWATVNSRRQYGIHVCNPILDPRDRTRDARKRMRDSSGFCATAYVCRDKVQNCSKTAPVAISLHSSYDIDPVDITTTMVKRGIVLYTGTMFLPEQFGTMTKYSDKTYGYNIVVDKHNAFIDKIFSHLSGTVNDARVKGKTLVIYTFPGGESREYCHDYDNLMKYTAHHTYKLRVENSSDDVIIEYKITRRVGSLIYFEFRQNFEKLPANLSIAKNIQPEPFDGYRVKLDASFLKPTIVKGVTPIEMFIPRGLFDVVASYCLTRVAAEDFTIEHALSYTRSVMSVIQINESTLALNNNDDSFDLMVTCSLAAYQWSHERYRLLESRVPYKKFIQRFNELSSTFESLTETFIDKDRLINDLKKMASKVGTSIINDTFTENANLRSKVSRITDLINKLKSPCIIELVDMAHMVKPIDIIQENTVRTDRSSSGSTLLYSSAVYALPTYPDYNQTVLPASGKCTHRRSKFIETEQLIEEIVEKRFKSMPNISTIQPTEIPVPVNEMEEILQANEDSDPINVIDLENLETVNQISLHGTHVHAIKDFIALAFAGDKERLDTARFIVDKAIDEEQTVPLILNLQADLKHEPIVLACIKGKIVSIRTINKTYYRGEIEFHEILEQNNKLKFCTKLYAPGKNELKFTILELKGEKFELDAETVAQKFDAIYVSEIQILLSECYKSLYGRICTMSTCQASTVKTILTDGVAGCGKTHAQVHAFAQDIIDGHEPAIFSATKAAATQALSRLKTMHVNASEANVCTVDSFLMNKNKWHRFTRVYVDEALQLHCGKIYALMEIANPETLTGFGDRRQITFINFTRMMEPSVDTSFPWEEEIQVKITRRLKRGKRINWLKHESLYGDGFDTAITDGYDKISVYARMPGLEKKVTSIEWLYKTAKLPVTEPLLVLVYRADIARDLRSKLHVSRTIPPEGSQHRLALATIGESQGEDVPHSLVIRLSSKEETIYTKHDQTIVGLTRSSVSWGYLSVPTEFPSLLEKIIASSEDSVNFTNLHE